MDYDQNIHSSKTPRPTQRSEHMAKASVILGSVALLTSSCLYLALVCSALGIILALLSKGGSIALNSQGKAGLLLSSAGLVLTILIYICVLLFVIFYYGGIDGFYQEYRNLYHAESIEELYRSMGFY